MSVNINRNVDDTFYRYKMPRLLAKVEGKGNGIKTVIVNMPDIAKALDRPPTYPTKYFGCELGAQTQVDSKNDRFIVNGEHDAGKLQDLLDGFIRKFVLCPECDNPETKLTVKRNDITQSCAACGHATILRSKHRLMTYITKNPPGHDSSDSASGDKAGKRDRRNRKSKGESVSSPTETIPNADTTDGFDNAFENGNGNGNHSDEVDDDDWAVNPEDAAKRQQELAPGMVGLTVNDDLEKDIGERLDMFYNFLKAEKDKISSTNGEIDTKKVIAEAERLDIKDKSVLLLCRVLLDVNVIQQVKTYRMVFLRFAYENKRAQKYLLGGLEQLIVLHKEKLLPKTSHILKAFYDADILEEEVILEWGAKASKRFVAKEDSKKIHEKAEPFLKWLAEAEEESEESGDEEGIEVVYDDDGTGDGYSGGRGRGRAAPLSVATMDSKGSSEGDNDDELSPVSNGMGGIGTNVSNGAAKDDHEDLNIDDI